MKVDCNYYTPFRAKAHNINKIHSNDPDGYYMYYKKIGILPAFKEHQGEYIAGIFASILALTALSMFAVKKSIPKSVVEIGKKQVGLNKKGVDKEFAEGAKDKILYPLMSVKKGQLRRLFDEQFASGMIVAGKEAEYNSQAFIEHAEALGIQCFRVDPKIEGKQNVLSNIYKIIADAKKAVGFSRKNCVIVDIGNIDKAVTMNKTKANKQDLSKIEKALTSLPRGVVWSGWTTSADKIPYYYNNTPTKLFFLPQ